MEKREAKTRQRSKTERDLLHWSGGWCIQRGSKNKTCMYRGGARVHEATFGTTSTERSRRSNRKQMLKKFKDSLQLGPQVYFYAASDENPGCERAVDKEWNKLETIPARQLNTVKSEKEVILEAQREKKSPLCYNDGHLSSQKMELESNFHKCKSRLVLRRDIVKDDSGAHAVFTEQGLSAFQLTA